MLKIALSGNAYNGHGPLFYYPFPFAITLLSNIGTALLTGCLAAIFDRRGVMAERKHAPGPRMDPSQTLRPVMPRVSSNSTLLEDIIFPEETDQQPAVAREVSHVSTTESENHPSVNALVTMGLLQGLSIAAKNEALLLLSVSSRTMIMNQTVLVVMLSAWACGLEKLHTWKLVAAGCLAMGGALQQMPDDPKSISGDWPPRGDDPLGYSTALVALLLDAAKWVLLQLYFKKATERGGDETGAVSSNSRQDSSKTDEGASRVGLSKLRMVSYVMWASTPVCITLVLAFEREALHIRMEDVVPLLRLVSLISVGVTGINVAEFGVVQYTSAVTFNVIAQLHSIPLLFCGVFFFGEDVTRFESLGFILALLGGLVYARSRAQETHDARIQASAKTGGFAQTVWGPKPTKNGGFAQTAESVMDV